MLAVCVAAPLHAQRTPAGTRIANTAVLTQQIDGRPVSVESNTVALTVDALINVAVVAQADTIRVPADGRRTVVAFDIVNTGNATERFTLGVVGDGDATIASFTTPEATTAVSNLDLRPGEQRTVYVVIDGLATTRQVTLTATATTGQGAPGTSFPGSNGGTAVLGPSGGSASATTTLVRAGTMPALTKSASVLAPNGTTRAMPGSIVTYRLDAVATATDPIRDAAIVDPVPEGTEFVAGSIVLDGRPQTDGADDDAASFDGTTVRVALGDVPAAAIRTVRFQVRIK